MTSESAPSLLGEPDSNALQSAKPLRTPSTHFSTWGIAIFIALLVFAAFGKSVTYDFLNWDDIIYIRDYPEVKEGLSWKGFVWAWTHPHYSNWHPLTTLSFMLDASLFGSNGSGFHAHNLILHALASILLFLALKNLSGSVYRSAFAACVFAIHPLRVESVVWITERKDVLSGVFLSATLLAYSSYVKAPNPKRYATLIALFACGLLSKSILVTLPALLLLLDFWPLQRGAFQPTPFSQTNHPFWPLIREKIPLFILSLASCAATLLSVDFQRPMSPPPFMARLAYAPVWTVAYLRHFFFPVNLGAHYPYSQQGPILSVTLGNVLLLITIAIFCLQFRRRYPVIFIGWSWFCISLLPVIGVIPPGIQMMADRYTYVSQIGLAIALSWGGLQVLSQLKNRWLAPLAALSFTAYLLLFAVHQTQFWKNDEMLWTHTLQVTKDNDFAHGQLGDTFAINQRMQEAEPLYREALRLNPNLAGVLNNLAIVERSKGNLAACEALLQKATELSPWFLNAQIDLSAVQISQNKKTEAIETLKKILLIEPNHYDSLFRLGILLSEGDPALADYPKAIDLLHKATQIQPENTQTYFILGNALYFAGKTPEAIQNLKKALEKDPTNARAANNLGTIQARLNDLSSAAESYQIAIRGDPSYLDPYDGLADILLRTKNVAGAVSVWRAALQHNPTHARCLFRLGWTLATTHDNSVRNGAEAEMLIKRAIESVGKREVQLLDALAAALAEQGRFTEAIALSNEAILLLNPQESSRAVQDIRARIDAYSQGKPIRASL